MRRIAPRALRRVCAAGLAAALAACSTESVMSLRPDVDVGAQTAGVPAAVAVAPVPTAPIESIEPVEPVEPTPIDPTVPTDPMTPVPADPMTRAPVDPRLAAYPHFEVPADPPDVMPAGEVDCRRDLKRLGVRFRDVSPIHEGSCGIDWPVEVSAIGSVRMKPAATLSCSMAATFSRWTKKELVPAARWRYLSGVKTIHQGSSYSCRNIRGSRGTPSQHSRGNALDVMRIELNNGKDIDVRKPGWFAFRQRGFLNTVRQDGCDYFTTVLGPGYNADHADHFHFDIMQRRNGYVACR
ncbi:extensin family protein [Mesorhizobium sp. LHD-90]|uniref:extensin-like domain-containing protein n=1 Tax=Mesorhizobium sp. LHD-90 TaxID=3071414 RepID=UPI0027E04D91|nr:extensin family protein [Mesorhizobium sp. LHD-90]MDQ6436504.1 extensin family protein [Mesorhizobium sp. LHD-90]